MSIDEEGWESSVGVDEAKEALGETMPFIVYPEPRTVARTLGRDGKPLKKKPKRPKLGDPIWERELLNAIEGSASRWRWHQAMDIVSKAVPSVGGMWEASSTGQVVIESSSSMMPGPHEQWDLAGDGVRECAAMMLDLWGRERTPGMEDNATVAIIDGVEGKLDCRGQRSVMDGLRKTFTQVQFIATTRSPQVLSSMSNREVRRVVRKGFDEGPVLVEGRDTNSIMRDYMETDERSDEGRQRAIELHDLLAEGRLEEAREVCERLSRMWSRNDPEIVFANTMIEDQ